MGTEVPSKNDIAQIFKRLRSIPTNKQCFDCGAQNPSWSSVTYGVFLCIDCSAVHRSLGVHLSFIRSTQLDTNWTWEQLRAMQVGGNAAALAFFRQHGYTSERTDAQQKYNSRAANMYREKLTGLAKKAFRAHGTKLHIENPQVQSDPTTPTPEKEVDFFSVHNSEASMLSGTGDNPAASFFSASVAVPITNGSSLTQAPVEVTDEATDGPNVDGALSVSPTEAQLKAEPRKATIGGRKPAPSKKGMATKKGGMGAQKVSTNFSDIETAAQLRDKATEKTEVAMTPEQEEKKMASMRLAYQDFSVEEKKRDEKMKHMDPKKAEQMERLGMGFGGSGAATRGVSHSMVSDMKTIEQETPMSLSGSNIDKYSSRGSRATTRDEDDFEIIDNFSSSRYGGSSFGMKDEDRYGARGSGGRSMKSSAVDNGASRFESKYSPGGMIEDIPSREADDAKGRNRKSVDNTPATDEARKKFGNAKAISSDQFFGGKNSDFETKATLSRFEGSSSISSADYFGEGRPGTSRNQDYNSGTDLSDIKDNVKEGVSKVASKISRLANGVMSSLQESMG